MATETTEDVDPDYEAVMGRDGDYYFPPKVCGAKAPTGAEDCRLEEGHAGSHSDLWAVWG